MLRKISSSGESSQNFVTNLLGKLATFSGTNDCQNCCIQIYYFDFLAVSLFHTEIVNL
jgi:hypothetical protein